MNITTIASAAALTALLTNANPLAAQAASDASLPASANALMTASIPLEVPSTVTIDVASYAKSRRTSTDDASSRAARSAERQPVFRFLTVEQEAQAYQAVLDARYNIEHSP